MILNLVINSYSQVTSITTIEDGFIIDFTLPTYTVKDTNIYEVYGVNQTYSYIEMEQLGQMMDIGYPSLPQHTIDLHLPDDALQFSVSVSNRVSELKYLTKKIIPAQDSDEEGDLVFCHDDYIFTNNETFHSGDRITYHAANDIIAAEGAATFTLEDGSEVNLIAGNSKTLKPGFSAELGSKFSASIAPCSSSSLKSAKINSESYTELDKSITTELNTDNSIKEHNIITCYPNPANENITFYFKIDSDRTTSISIIDILGNKVIMKTLENTPANEWSKVNLNISNLPVGTYFYLINYYNSYEKGKFIKVK